MDDFGNDYQDETWAMTCCESGHSMATFGMYDDTALDMCLTHCLNIAAQDI